MGDGTAGRSYGWKAAVAFFAVLVGACSGDSGPTTTRFVPPTSEVIFELTTTTSTPPALLGAIPIASLGVSVDLPFDWEIATDNLRFGRASAGFRADNGTGGLIVVGAVDDVIPGADQNADDELARQLATLLNVTDPLPDEAVQRTLGPAGAFAGDLQYNFTHYAVTEVDGAVATLELNIYPGTEPLVFVAILYQEGFPEARIEQTRVAQTLEAG